MADTPGSLVRFLPRRDLEDVHYQLALDLVAHVHPVIEQATTRFHLKNQLDRLTTSVTLTLSSIKAERRTRRWRSYREIHSGLLVISAVLDIFARQRCTTATADLLAAQLIVKQLVDEIRPLTNTWS